MPNFGTLPISYSVSFVNEWVHFVVIVIVLAPVGAFIDLALNCVMSAFWWLMMMQLLIADNSYTLMVGDHHVQEDIWDYLDLHCPGFGLSRNMKIFLLWYNTYTTPTLESVAINPISPLSRQMDCLLPLPQPPFGCVRWPPSTFWIGTMMYIWTHTVWLHILAPGSPN